MSKKGSGILTEYYRIPTNIICGGTNFLKINFCSGHSSGVEI